MVNLAIIFAIAISAVAAVKQNEIDRINKVQSLWKAEKNEVTEKGHSFMKHLLGAKFSKDKEYRDDIEIAADIPTTFDARTQWPKCQSISAIKNQGHCGSCWAVAATSVASDRLCISTHGKTQLNISAENLLACCHECVDPGTRGCDGGYPERAWQYFRKTGIVTGGDYDSYEGCQPYEIAPTCNMYTPPCHKKCTNKRYKVSYKKDKHYGKTAYAIPQNIAAIQTEILKNGPIEAGFEVYYDFFSYKSGVYVKTSDELEGGHAVRVLGWGVEGGVDYWLAANSWGRKWGENGAFKIRRGTNECDFEANMVAGLVRK